MNFKKEINHNGHNEHNEEKSLWDSFLVRGWLNATFEKSGFSLCPSSRGICFAACSSWLEFRVLK